MAKSKPKLLISKAQYEGFGRIIYQFAELEAALYQAIHIMSGTTRVAHAIVAGWEMTFTNKRHVIGALADLNAVEGKVRDDLDTLLRRADSCNTMRNTIAHCRWSKGPQRGTITPFQMHVKGKLKFSGQGIKEETFDAQRLHKEAQTIRRLRDDFKDFLEIHEDELKPLE